MNPTDSVTRRFNPHVLVKVRKERAHWLRTQKWTGAEWITLARWAPLRDSEDRELQRESMTSHASAFGGQVRLLKGALLLASWRDGVLECDLREVA